MAERDEFGAFLIGFIIGGLTGAAVSLLLAPQSGEDTRLYIKDRAIELRDKAQETAQVTAEQVSSTASQVRTKTGDMATKAKTNAQVVLEEQKAKLQGLSGAQKPGEETSL